MLSSALGIVAVLILLACVVAVKKCRNKRISESIRRTRKHTTFERNENIHTYHGIYENEIFQTTSDTEVGIVHDVHLRNTSESSDSKSTTINNSNEYLHPYHTLQQTRMDLHKYDYIVTDSLPVSSEIGIEIDGQQLHALNYGAYENTRIFGNNMPANFTSKNSRTNTSVEQQLFDDLSLD